MDSGTLEREEDFDEDVCYDHINRGTTSNLVHFRVKKQPSSQMCLPLVFVNQQKETKKNVSPQKPGIVFTAGKENHNHLSHREESPKLSFTRNRDDQNDLESHIQLLISEFNQSTEEITKLKRELREATKKLQHFQVESKMFKCVFVVCPHSFRSQKELWEHFKDHTLSEALHSWTMFHRYMSEMQVQDDLHQNISRETS